MNEMYQKVQKKTAVNHVTHSNSAEFRPNYLHVPCHVIVTKANTKAPLFASAFNHFILS